MPLLHVKLNYFSFRRCLSEIVYFNARKLAWNYFKIISEALLQLTNIIQRVQCRLNNFEIISELFQQSEYFDFSFRRGYV